MVQWTIPSLMWPCRCYACLSVIRQGRSGYDRVGFEICGIRITCKSSPPLLEVAASPTPPCCKSHCDHIIVIHIHACTDYWVYKRISRKVNEPKLLSQLHDFGELETCYGHWTGDLARPKISTCEEASKALLNSGDLPVCPRPSYVTGKMTNVYLPLMERHEVCQTISTFATHFP